MVAPKSVKNVCKNQLAKLVQRYFPWQILTQLFFLYFLKVIFDFDHDTSPVFFSLQISRKMACGTKHNIIFYCANTRIKYIWLTDLLVP